MNVNDKLSLFDELKLNKEKYLPVINHAWKVFSQRNEEDLNIGWDVGIIGENRPYFCEAWASGFTVLTYYISRVGIEGYSVEQIENLLKEEKIVWYVGERAYPTSVAICKDDLGNEFFSVNIIVGDDCGVYIEGGVIYGISKLNAYNCRYLERQ